MSEYCIYLDGLSDDMSKEHIFPMSLGGLDSFCIQADRKFNNTVGSRVDGAIANDFLMLFKRDRAEAKGHSGTHPEPIARRATLEDGTPIQAIFSKTGLRLYDLKQKRYLAKGEGTRTIKVSDLKLDMDADIRFVAKIALAAGYYAYDDFFKNGVQHSQARMIVTAKHLTDVNPSVRLYTRFQDPKELPDPSDYQLFKAAIELSGCSCVLMLPGKDCFGVIVGVLGEFMGMINIPANTTGFPNEGAYSLGHCIFLQEGKVKRMSFRHLCNKLLEAMEKNDDKKNAEPKGAEDEI